MGSSNENSAYGPVLNPWDTGAGAGRLLRRLRGRGRRTARPLRDRHRHRRVDPPAGLAVRDRRPEADLRRDLALRDDRLRLLAGPVRDADPRRRRRRAAAAGDGGPRRLRLDLGRDRGRGGRAPRERTSRASASASPASSQRRPRASSRRSRRRSTGARHDPRAWGRGRRVRASPLRPGPLGLLRDRPGGGIGEPRPLRRRSVRPPRGQANGDLVAMYERTREAGIRRRGEAADHARHLRAVVGLLRRLLRPCPARPDQDRRGLHRRLRAVRLPRHPDLADRRLQARRASRQPTGDVPVRLLHGADVARRNPRDLDSGRARGARRRRPRASGRPADRRARVLGVRGCSTPLTRSRRGSGSTPGRREPRRERGDRIRGRDRARDPRAAQHPDEDVLRVRALVRRSAEHPHLPGLPRAPRNASGRQRAGGPVRAPDRPCPRLRGVPTVDLSPQELLLPRQPEGLPDQPVRHPARHRGQAGRRSDPPRPSRGGRREDDPRRAVGPDPRLGGLPGGLQPGWDAAGRDRHRARPPQPRRGARVGPAAADDGQAARRLGRQHGGGQPALRRQRLGPAARRVRARASRPSSRT